MSLITNQNVEIPQTDTSGQIKDIPPVDKIDPIQSEQFSDLLDDEKNKLAKGQEVADDQISPEELQRQIQENLFKNGFNKAMEKAREISKELKDG